VDDRLVVVPAAAADARRTGALTGEAIQSAGPPLREGVG